MLFSDLIVWYLFLGGLGAGLSLTVLFVELRARTGSGPWIALSQATKRPALVGSFVSMCAGSLCLMKDLALPDKALLLFIKPTFSAITIGTYALTGLLVCLALLIALAFSERPVRPAVQTALRVCTAILSGVVVVYTGVLLSSMSAVPLWLSLLVPALFTLSSLSSGIACVAILVAFPRPELHATRAALRSLLRIDIAFVGLEIVSVAAMAVHLSGNPAALASVETLVAGQLAPQFWLGFITCGLIAPLVLEVVQSLRLSHRPAFYIAVGCLILVGAFFLRYCTIFGGVHLSAFMFAL